MQYSKNSKQNTCEIKTTLVRNTIMEWSATALLLGLTLIIFYSTGLFEKVEPANGLEKYLLWPGIFIIIFIVLGIHELGHLVAGITHGFKFKLFVIGPLGIKEENGKIKIYLNKEIGYYGGIAASLPENDDPGNAEKFGRVILAGPLASLLFSILCLVPAYLVIQPFREIFVVCSLVSITIFYVTVIPSSTGTFFTDRKRYQRLTAPGDDQKTEMALLRIVGKYSQSNSYSNIDKKDILVLVNDRSPFLKFAGLFYLLCYEAEIEKQLNPQTEQLYRRISEGMSKGIVKSFNQEIDNHKTKYLAPR